MFSFILLKGGDCKTGACLGVTAALHCVDAWIDGSMDGEYFFFNVFGITDGGCIAMETAFESGLSLRLLYVISTKSPLAAYARA